MIDENSPWPQDDPDAPPPSRAFVYTVFGFCVAMIALLFFGRGH